MEKKILRNDMITLKHILNRTESMCVRGLLWFRDELSLAVSAWKLLSDRLTPALLSKWNPAIYPTFAWTTRLQTPTVSQLYYLQQILSVSMCL